MMKKASFILLALIFIVYSCAEIEVNPNKDSLFENISLERVFSKEELKEINFETATGENFEKLKKLGFWDGKKGQNCEWSDGVGGSLGCDSGTCSVVFYTSQTGITYAGILCSEAGVPQQASLFRQI